jgi:hypothetical protein
LLPAPNGELRTILAGDAAGVTTWAATMLARKERADVQVSVE